MLMKKVKITALRRSVYQDLINKYENPIENPCDISDGDSFISINGECPKRFCPEAWKSIEYFVKELTNGGGNFFNGWMKNEKSAMVSCNDGFRPVTFLIEVID